MLQVEKLRKVYGQNMQYEALKGIDLTVNDGEFVGWTAGLFCLRNFIEASDLL